MKHFNGRTAVITGAASGLGLEVARVAAREGMNLVMADLHQDALDGAVAEITALGAKVLPFRLDVSKASDVEALGASTLARFGVPHFVFNNAGIAIGGLVWEHSIDDWEWVLGVNLMGVAHGVRVFTPMMIEAARKDAAYEGHIVNTASMAGMVNMPNTALYNVSKFGVVALTETLYQDLALVTEQVHCSLLCPFYVATAIFEADRHRPGDATAAPLTKSQMVAKTMGAKAVSSAKVSAAEVAQFVFEAMLANRFYVFSHPHALGAIATRMEDILQIRNPSDPFKEKPHIGESLRAAIRRG